MFKKKEGVTDIKKNDKQQGRDAKHSQVGDCASSNGTLAQKLLGRQLPSGGLQRHLLYRLYMVLWSSDGNISALEEVLEAVQEEKSNTHQVNTRKNASAISQLEEMCVLSASPLGGVLST